MAKKTFWKPFRELPDADSILITDLMQHCIDRLNSVTPMNDGVRARYIHTVAELIKMQSLGLGTQEDRDLYSIDIHPPKPAIMSVGSKAVN